LGWNSPNIFRTETEINQNFRASSDMNIDEYSTRGSKILTCFSNYHFDHFHPIFNSDSYRKSLVKYSHTL
jgi:predicted metallo-beta-lactamase superfamily hydrolase